MASSYTGSWAGDGQVDQVSLSSGRRLRYLKMGRGTPLVLMHTLRTQLDYFQRLIPLLTDRYTVYAVDLPGMGWSEITPGGDYREPAVRRDMAEFIERLALADVILAGESMGATLALSIAAGLGARVRHVAALNPYDYPQGVERANALASLVIKMMRIPLVGLLVASLENELILGGILRGGFFDGKKLPGHLVTELIRSGRRGGYAKVETAYLHALGSFIEARQFYGRVEAPVTLVYGDHDWSKPADREAVAWLLPASRRVTLAETGHFASLERPDEVARILNSLGE